MSTGQPPYPLRNCISAGVRALIPPMKRNRSRLKWGRSPPGGQQPSVALLPFRERRSEGCVQGSELHVLPQRPAARVSENPGRRNSSPRCPRCRRGFENGLGVEQMLINLIEIAQRNPAPRHERQVRSAVCGGGQFFPQAVQQRQAFHHVEGTHAVWCWMATPRVWTVGNHRDGPSRPHNSVQTCAPPAGWAGMTRHRSGCGRSMTC